MTLSGSTTPGGKHSHTGEHGRVLTEGATAPGTLRDATRCAAMRCDAMQCDAIHRSTGTDNFPMWWRSGVIRRRRRWGRARGRKVNVHHGSEIRLIDPTPSFTLPFPRLHEYPRAHSRRTKGFNSRREHEANRAFCLHGHNRTITVYHRFFPRWRIISPTEPLTPLSCTLPRNVTGRRS
jgi:hypothetical protein